MQNPSRTNPFLFTLLSVILALVIAALLVLSIGKNPLDVLTNILEGAFRNTNAFTGVLNFWIPLSLACVALIVTFRAGLWNIGIEGQILMGAIFASWGALNINLPPELSPILILIEIGLAIIGGMLWAGIVGVLKVWLGVNEIFGGMALNSLASVWAIYLVAGPWYPEGGSAQSSAPFPSHAVLPGISSEWPVSLFALIITGLALIVVPFLLDRTRWGLQLKATGKNPRSALLLGVATDRIAMSAFLVCGALAGVAGAYRVLFTYGSFRPLASGSIGFLGLLVVLLASSRAVWVPLITFAFSAILAGSTRLRVSMQLDASLAGVLQGTVVLLFLLLGGVRQRIEQNSKAAQSTHKTNAIPDTTSEVISR
ncbi:MAG: sugar ABC transporter permease [Anaerolineaceae bacterium]|nr:sugar ABC transporter permease [Anaerolineaceae bacterium]